MPAERMTPESVARSYDRLASHWSSESYPADYGISQHERALAFCTRKRRAGLDEPGEKFDTAMGVDMYYATLGVRRTLDIVAECGCVCRHLEYDQLPEPHAYVIAQRDAESADPQSILRLS